jgi:hypothetical protein
VIFVAFVVKLFFLSWLLRRRAGSFVVHCFHSYPIAVVIGVAAACFAGPNPANRQSTTAATRDRTATP